MHTATDKRQIRRQLRQARQKLSLTERQLARHRFGQQLSTSAAFLRAQHIALYWPMAEEADPLDVLQHPLAARKQWYLPVIQPQGMAFYPYRPGQPLRRNRYGIPEPSNQQKSIKAWQLDLVIVPLVGFDEQLTRMGMGGGYYDRYFDRKHTRIKQPYYLGLGFECQKSEKNLPKDEWDLTLDAMLTEQRWYRRYHPSR